MATVVEGALALLLSAMPVPGADLHSVEMGPGDIPKGTFCRVLDVCVIAQTDADCGKISGKTFPTLEACTGAAAAAPQQTE
jgi:hypothetical protein